MRYERNHIVYLILGELWTRAPIQNPTQNDIAKELSLSFNCAKFASLFFRFKILISLNYN